MTTAPSVSTRSHRLGVAASRALWRRWVAANAVGEFVGLGLTGVVGAAIVWALDPRWPVLAAVALVASGAIEGAIVGVAQWQALRDRIAVTARRWTTATIVGALAAWAAGVTPMLLADQGGGTAAEPALPLQLMLAALLGLIAGPVLGGPQAWVLRGVVPRPWRWVAANAAAWGLALPITFLAPNVLPADASAATLALAFAAGALVAGAIAGAVHGIMLVALAGGRVFVGDATAAPLRVAGDRRGHT